MQEVGVRVERRSGSVPVGVDDKRPVPSSEVTACPLDDELVLCDARTGQVYVLSPSAARIWSLCNGTHTIGELARSMVDDYGIDPRRALADVREVIASLEDAGLLAIT